jgi:phosphatidylethanolamine-binding protein (PEBP) family uncharacterized protein
MVERAGWHQVTRAAGLRSRRAVGQRILALGHLRHSAGHHRPRARRRKQCSAAPAGAFGGNTDFLDTGATGVNGNYGGPCPPAGDPPHRYIFTLFAVAVDKLEVAGGVPKTGTAGLYGFVLNKGIGANLLGKASFTAMYGR